MSESYSVRVKTEDAPNVRRLVERFCRAVKANVGTATAQQPSSTILVFVVDGCNLEKIALFMQGIARTYGLDNTADLM